MAGSRREDVDWWFRASVDDYESAQLLFRGGKYSKSIHVLHNASEKVLKAAILAEGKRPPRGAAGHNLVRLCEMLGGREIPARLVRMLQDLSPLYLPSEYPDAALGVPGTIFKKGQAERYVREVGSLIRWLRKSMSRG